MRVLGDDAVNHRDLVRLEVDPGVGERDERAVLMGEPVVGGRRSEVEVLRRPRRPARNRPSGSSMIAGRKPISATFVTSPANATFHVG